jgi:hypothetical protein
MSDNETKYKHSYKRNIAAKHLRDQGELKGAFSLKIIDGRKEEYKRKRMRINEIADEQEEY